MYDLQLSMRAGRDVTTVFKNRIIQMHNDPITDSNDQNMTTTIFITKIKAFVGYH